MGVELFDRRAQVIVAPIDGGEGLDASGLRCVFKVSKTSTSEPNTATVTLYNLAEGSRGRIKAKDQAVVLKAGYRDLVEQVAVGIIKRVKHERQGVDIATKMELKDGGQDLLEPELKRSYSGGTSRRRIVEDILSTMPHTSKGRINATGISGSISGKMCFSTTSKLAMDRIAKAWDFEWSIQDGALQVLDHNGTVEPVELALVIGPSTGLLGSPARTGQEGRKTKGSKKRKRKEQSGAKFQTLLMPSIRPGRYVLLESEFLAGAFKVQSVEHSGDTHGTDWHTDVEAIQI